MACKFYFAVNYSFQATNRLLLNKILKITPKDQLNDQPQYPTFIERNTNNSRIP